MAFVNPDKCFALPKIESPPTIDPQIESQSPEELINALDVSLGLSSLNLSATVSDLFLKHIGPISTYSNKKELINQLKHLASYLLSPPKPLTDDAKGKIASKLTEDIEFCTPGFHNRVKQIISALYHPETLDFLLYQIRHNIVLHAAVKVTGEVHTNNRFYIVAESLQYGVEPLNQNDPHRGNISDTSIQQYLKTAFDENYRFIIILNELIEGMKVAMHSQYEYQGCQAEGYKLPEYGAFQSYLEKILSPDEISYEMFFILDKDNNIIDVNWKKIKQCLLKKLHDQHYIILNKRVYNCLLDMLDNKSPADIDLSCLFDSVITNSKELISLLSFIGDDNRNMQLRLIFTAIGKITTIQYPEIIIWAAQHQVLDAVLAQIQNLNEDEQIKMLTQPTSDGNNALMLAARYQSDAVTRLLKHVKRLNPTVKTKVLTQADSYDWNALMLAARYQPDAVTPLLEYIEKLDSTEKTKILTQTSRMGNNALMLAARYQPDAVTPLLEYIKKLDPTEQTKILNQFTKFMFTKQFKPTENAQMLAIIDKLKHSIAVKTYEAQIRRFGFQAQPLEGKSTKEIEKITPSLWIYMWHHICEFFIAFAHCFSTDYGNTTAPPIQK